MEYLIIAVLVVLYWRQRTELEKFRERDRKQGQYMRAMQQMPPYDYMADVIRIAMRFAKSQPDSVRALLARNP